MGKADVGTKEFLKLSEIFAQLFNVAVFQGIGQLKPEDLQELDSSYAVSVPLTSKRPKYMERIRDIKKIAKPGFALQVVLGIEAQTAIHYYMPIRYMHYDALEYEEQCKRKSAEAKNKTKILYR